MKIRELKLVRSKDGMRDWPAGKFLIDTINTHSFVLARKDEGFADALRSADALLPDGIGIVKACRWLKMKDAPIEKIAGADLFRFEMEQLNGQGGTCFFMGSSLKVLDRIRAHAALFPRYHPGFRGIHHQPVRAGAIEGHGFLRREIGPGHG